MGKGKDDFPFIFGLILLVAVPHDQENVQHARRESKIEDVSQISWFTSLRSYISSSFYQLN